LARHPLDAEDRHPQTRTRTRLTLFCTRRDFDIWLLITAIDSSADGTSATYA
jgi:hypothetical protein